MKRRVPQGDPKLAVAYLRVSTDKQELGLQAQRAAIEAWAVRDSVRVVEWFEERDVSGALEEADRPELLRCLERLAVAHAGLLVVAKRDRLARDAFVAGSIERSVQRVGARVVHADGIGSGDTPADALVRTVLDGVAAFERHQIKGRIKAALAEKSKRAERVGKIPYGYRLKADEVPVKGQPRHIEPDPYEQRVLFEVHELLGRGASHREIAKHLVTAGFVSRAGRPFWTSQVQRMTLGRERLTVKHRPERVRTFRRRIEPSGHEMDVDLYDFLRPCNLLGPNSAFVEPICDEIECGAITLCAISPFHVLDPYERQYFDVNENILRFQNVGGPSHARLTLLLALYLRRLGKEVTSCNNGSAAAYAGGWGDISVSDHSVIVECGNYSAQKALNTFTAGQTLIVAPYLPVPVLRSLPTDLRIQSFADDPKLRGFAPAFAFMVNDPTRLKEADNKLNELFAAKRREITLIPAAALR